MRRLSVALMTAAALMFGAGTVASSAGADSFTPVRLAIAVAPTAVAGTPLDVSVTVSADPGVLDTAEGQLEVGVKLAPECGGNFETTPGTTLLHAALDPAPQTGQAYTGTVRGSGVPPAAGVQAVCVYLEDTGADRVYANDESGEVTVAPAGGAGAVHGPGSAGAGSGSGTTGSGSSAAHRAVTAAQRALRRAGRALARARRRVSADRRAVAGLTHRLTVARAHHRSRAVIAGLRTRRRAAQTRLARARATLRADRRRRTTAAARLRTARRRAGQRTTRQLTAPRLAADRETGHAADALPPIRHVFVIVLENESDSTTFGPGSPAPYLAQTLPSEGAYLPDYYAVGHNSNDNYIAMISGQAPGIQSQGDCPVFDDLLPGTIGADGQAIGTGCVYPADVPTIASQLTAAGDTWRDYNESMGNDPTRESSVCGHPAIGARDMTQTAEAQDMYTTRHNPFVYFHSIIDDTTLCDTHVVNLDALPQDLASAGSTANYSFITPDLCDDGHDAPCANGQPGGLTSANAFLKTWVPKITASPAFQQNGLLIVTFDEAEDDDATACCGEIPGPNSPLPGITGPGGGDVGAVLLSPFIAPGTVSQTAYNHYSMLGSVEDLFGLSHLGDAQLPGETDFGSDVYTDPAGTGLAGGGAGGSSSGGGSGAGTPGNGAGGAGSGTGGSGRAGTTKADRGRDTPRVTVRRTARVCTTPAATRVRLRWHGAGRGARYQLEVRDGGVRDPRWRTLRRATRRFSATVTVRAGHVDAIRVRATSHTGRTGPWSTVRVVIPAPRAARRINACRPITLTGGGLRTR